MKSPVACRRLFLPYLSGLLQSQVSVTFSWRRDIKRRGKEKGNSVVGSRVKEPDGPEMERGVEEAVIGMI